MSLGILTLYLQLPGCNSLKEKRGILKPVLARLHREFNVSTAEVGQMDQWRESVLACAVVSNDPDHCMRVMQEVVKDTERTWPNLLVVDQRMELVAV